MVSEDAGSEIIGNVPNELVEQFQKAFPDNPNLCEYVRRGWCDHVGEILEALGGLDDNLNEYRNFNDEQKTAAASWWHLYNEIWFSK